MMHAKQVMRKKLTPETILKKQCNQYLRCRGWMVISNVAGIGSYPGLSDITAVKDGRVLWIEYKSPGVQDIKERTLPGMAQPRHRGRQSDHQKQFEAQLKAHGGEYLLVRSLDDLMGYGV
jgi:hypothetical protein